MIPISKSHCIIQYEIDLLCDPQLLQKGMGQATWAAQVLNSYSDAFIDHTTIFDPETGQYWNSLLRTYRGALSRR